MLLFTLSVVNTLLIKISPVFSYCPPFLFRLLVDKGLLYDTPTLAAATGNNHEKFNNRLVGSLKTRLFFCLDCQ